MLLAAQSLRSENRQVVIRDPVDALRITNYRTFARAENADVDAAACLSRDDNDYAYRHRVAEDGAACLRPGPVHSVVRAVVLGLVHRMMQGVVHAMVWTVDCADCSADWGADYGVWCRVWCRVWCGVYNAM